MRYEGRRVGNLEGLRIVGKGGEICTPGMSSWFLKNARRIGEYMDSVKGEAPRQRIRLLQSVLTVFLARYFNVWLNKCTLLELCCFELC